MSETGFTSMAGAKSESAAPEIGIGMLGYAFMGKAHSNAFKKLPYMMYPPVAIPRLAAIAGRSESAVKEAAARYGYAKYYTDWRDLIADENVQLFDNGGPNDTHADPCIEAAKAVHLKLDEIIRALNDVGYQGPLSVEWEDGKMDREHGAVEACAFVRKLDFAPSAIAFDSAFEKK